MRRIALTCVAVAGAVLVLLPPPAPVEATSARTWVASNGTNNVTCSRAAPCLTFDQAHTATTAGGEINCVDAADYGGLTITKSISIVCDNTEASIRAATGSIAINVTAAATDIVTLKGIDIDGGGSGVVGIDFFTGGVLHLHKVRISNFGASGVPLISGIIFQPTGYAELYVVDSVITDNAGSPAFPPSAGILIRPRMTGSANVFINRVRVENNAVGIFADGTQTTGAAVSVLVQDSVVSGSGGDGITATTAASKAAVSVTVDGSRIATNFSSGVSANGVAASGAGSAVARIGRSTIVNNVTGVSATGLGVVQSFKNNRISGNLSDGTPLTAFPGPGGVPLQ